MFYHEIKEHMSPSAIQQWLRQRSSFVGSYFDKKERVDTAAMSAGRKIHKLIEGGMIEAKKVYEINEEPIKVQVPGTDFYFLGVPDSRKKDGTKFVDYKSGKANEWDKKLPTDIKMRATAWLIWQEAGEKPKEIEGSVEFIQTTWDPIVKEVVPIEKETEVITIKYSAEELKDFTSVITKSMEDVNEFYEKWKNKTDAFINEELVSKYEELDRQKKEIEESMSKIKEDLIKQMDMGGKDNHNTERGTFYITRRETYSFPDNLPVKVGKKKYTLEEAENIESVAKAAKKNYKLNSEPVSVSESLGYRAKK